MKRLFFLLFFLLIATTAEGAIRYASTTGSGTACTNIATPCTVNTAIGQMTSGGDTLLIRAGTYNQSISWPTGGSSGAPNIISAYPGDNCTLAACEQVIFRPTGSQLTVNGGTSANAWTTFNGLILDGAGGTGGGMSICCHYTANIVFQNGEIRNFFGSGFDVFAENITVRNTKIHNNGSDTLTGPPHGLYIACRSGCVFEDNEIYNNYHYGFHIYDSGASNVSGNIIRRNRIYGNGKSTTGLTPGGFGLLLSSGSNNQAYENTLWDNGASGLTSGAIQVQNCANCLVFKNVIYSNANYGLDIYATASGTIFRDNIIWLNGIGAYNNAGSGTTQSHNLCTSGCTGTNAINGTDPQFVNAAANDFRLQLSSPAIDTGTSAISALVVIPACSVSITTSCYNGANPDMGAFESTPAGPPSLMANLTTVTQGAAILVTVTENTTNQRTELVGDWVGILPTGSANYDQAPIDWFYINGTKIPPTTPVSNAVLNFTAPASVATYDFVFYPGTATQANDYLATATFNVIAPGIVLKLSSSTLKVGPGVTFKIGVP